MSLTTRTLPGWSWWRRTPNESSRVLRFNPTWQALVASHASLAAMRPAHMDWFVAELVATAQVRTGACGADLVKVGSLSMGAI